MFYVNDQYVYPAKISRMERDRIKIRFHRSNIFNGRQAADTIIFFSMANPFDGLIQHLFLDEENANVLSKAAYLSFCK